MNDGEAFFPAGLIRLVVMIVLLAGFIVIMIGLTRRSGKQVSGRGFEVIVKPPDEKKE